MGGGKESLIHVFVAFFFLYEKKSVANSIAQTRAPSGRTSVNLREVGLSALSLKNIIQSNLDIEQVNKKDEL